MHRGILTDDEQGLDPADGGRGEPLGQSEAEPVSDVQRQALQMLTLAQRTAEEHVADAHRGAEDILARAGAAAELMVREAQAQVEVVRAEADTVLSDARARAAQVADDARVQAENARRDGGRIVADAEARAAEMVEDARVTADGLARQAGQRYEEMVGSLAAEREALQRQIEALQEFDRGYRARLLRFMQAQLRALWVDEPRVVGEVEPSGVVATGGLVPAQRSDSEPTTGVPPALPSSAERS